MSPHTSCLMPAPPPSDGRRQHTFPRMFNEREPSIRSARPIMQRCVKVSSASPLASITGLPCCFRCLALPSSPSPSIPPSPSSSGSWLDLVVIMKVCHPRYLQPTEIDWLHGSPPPASVLPARSFTWSSVTCESPNAKCLCVGFLPLLWLSQVTRI